MLKNTMYLEKKEGNTKQQHKKPTKPSVPMASIQTLCVDKNFKNLIDFSAFLQLDRISSQLILFHLLSIFIRSQK